MRSRCSSAAQLALALLALASCVPTAAAEPVDEGALRAWPHMSPTVCMLLHACFSLLSHARCVHAAPPCLTPSAPAVGPLHWRSRNHAGAAPGPLRHECQLGCGLCGMDARRPHPPLQVGRRHLHPRRPHADAVRGCLGSPLLGPQLAGTRTAVVQRAFAAGDPPRCK